MSAKKVKVQIKTAKGHCTVKPSVIIVDPGGTILFTKSIPDTVYIQVSGFGPVTKIAKLTTHGKMTVPKNAKMGIHPYAVFCYERKTFCTGSSMPIIIVPR